MRQLIFRVPRGEGERVIAAEEERGRVNLSVVGAKEGGLGQRTKQEPQAQFLDFTSLVNIELLEPPR